MRRRLCAGDKEEVAFAEAPRSPSPSSPSSSWLPGGRERKRSSKDVSVSVSSISSLFLMGIGFVSGRCGGRRGRAGRGEENECRGAWNGGCLTLALKENLGADANRGVGSS